MAFFDDLRATVGAVPGSSTPSAAEVDLQRVFDKLATGWKFEVVESRRKTGDEQRGLSTNLETEVWFEDGRYVVVSRLVERRGDAFCEVFNEDSQRTDRQGLIELLAQRPLLEQRLCEAAGVRSGPSEPDPRGY